MKNNTIYEVFNVRNDVPPILSKHFLRFLLKENIYTPYMGRLSESGFDFGSITTCIHMINRAFIFMPSSEKYMRISGGRLTVEYFNSLVNSDWWKCATNWCNYCKKKGLHKESGWTLGAFEAL